MLYLDPSVVPKAIITDNRYHLIYSDMPVAVLPPEDEDYLSFSSTALQILTQDVSSLLSLSLETTASVLHDWFRSSLGVVGFGGEFAPRDRQKTYTEGESGRNLAVVIVGAGEGKLFFPSVL